jgi:hypothetical protein
MTVYLCPACCCVYACSVGMLFLPNDDAVEAQCKTILEATLAQEGLKLLGYRTVPVKHEVVGRFAKATQPRIMQVGLSAAERPKRGGGRRQGGVAGQTVWSELCSKGTRSWRGPPACCALPLLPSSCQWPSQAAQYLDLRQLQLHGGWCAAAGSCSCTIWPPHCCWTVPKASVPPPVSPSAHTIHNTPCNTHPGVCGGQARSDGGCPGA